MIIIECPDCRGIGRKYVVHDSTLEARMSEAGLCSTCQGSRLLEVAAFRPHWIGQEPVAAETRLETAARRSSILAD